MQNQEIILKGIPISRGIAIGKPFLFHSFDQISTKNKISPEKFDKEIFRYREALKHAQDDIHSLKEQLKNIKYIDGLTLLESQLEMLQDPFLILEVEKEIKTSRKTAEEAFKTIIDHFQNKFNQLPDPFFRERFKEIQDISKRVYGYLQENHRLSLVNLPRESIIFSRDLSVSETAEAYIGQAEAFVTEHGGSTSHAAIIAKNWGTPYVSSIAFEKIDPKIHLKVIVDGRTGEIILNPTPETLIRYHLIRDQLNTHIEKLTTINTFKAETIDGYSIQISANIETTNELEIVHKNGGHGVGLFRSEYIFLAKSSFPSEEEQYNIYLDLVQKSKGFPIVIRTFDVGGDKHLPHENTESNSVLGCRAIRFSLKERYIFKNQLRAILRASCLGNVSIMFPLISTISELKEAKLVLNECKMELEQKNIAFGNLRIGCMIEVPSAAIIADLLAKECDFLSIGTNDLVQYALAVDRSNHAMNSLYTPAHPSVLRMIKSVVQEANQHGIPVTLCGEVAADPRFTALLIGLGIHELSVSPPCIPTVKNAIRHTSIVASSKLAEEALTLSTAHEIQEFLTAAYKEDVPEDCFYNY